VYEIQSVNCLHTQWSMPWRCSGKRTWTCKREIDFPFCCIRSGAFSSGRTDQQFRSRCMGRLWSIASTLAKKRLAKGRSPHSGVEIGQPRQPVRSLRFHTPSVEVDVDAIDDMSVISIVVVLFVIISLPFSFWSECPTQMVQSMGF